MRRNDEMSLVIHIGDRTYSQTDVARTDMAGVLEWWSEDVLKNVPQVQSNLLFESDFETATQAVLHSAYDYKADVEAARAFMGEEAWNSIGYLLPFGPWFENVFIGIIRHRDLIRLWGGAFDIPDNRLWQPVWIDKFDTNVLASEFFAEFERLNQQLTRHCNS